MLRLLRSIYSFYADGFRAMTLGRTLWVIILIKLSIMFLILRPLLFPNLLGRLDGDKARTEHVVKELTEGGTRQ